MISRSEQSAVRGIFVAGSGTGVGKTVCTAALLRALRLAGMAVQAVKPVQTGVAPDDGAMLADTTVCDAAVADLPSCGLPIAATLHSFALSASPHLAAEREGASLDCNRLCTDVHAHFHDSRADFLLLEGAGGVRVPLNQHEDMLDFMVRLDLPVLLVGDNCLGGLNHILLSLDALRGRGLFLCGLALVPAADPSAGCPGVDVPALLADNAAALRCRLQQEGWNAPLVEVPRLPALDTAAWKCLAEVFAPLAHRLVSDAGKRRSEQRELLPRDRCVLWHPYASVTEPPPLHVAERTFSNRIRLEDGRELVDGMSSWWAAVHGYNHPRLLAALREQSGRMPHVMFGGLTHEPAVCLAERLLALMPAGLERIFFADSGSVAVEIALKMALQYQHARGEKQRTRFLAPLGGYHGDTFGAMSVCDPVAGMHSLFSGMLPRQIFVERPSCRFDHPFDPGSLDAVRTVLRQRGEEIAAVILEPVVQGAGGMWFYHPGYVRELSRLCRENRVLFILDEIATGFGRTGKMFAAFWADVQPDILCCGKALTGGMLTFAATACTEQVANGICAEGGVFMHGPTYMANALACAVAGASLDILENEDWCGRVATLEQGLRGGLAACADLPGVRDVRVLGGIGVVEMSEPVNTASLQSFFVSRGVWLRPFQQLIYLMPPYITPATDVDRLCEAVHDAVLSGAYMP